MSAKTEKTERGICHNSKDAVAFWRPNAGHAAEHVTESLWIVTLDKDRHFIGCHSIETKVFSSPGLLADEVLSAEHLKGIEEFIFLHHRPGVPPDADGESKARARALILEARKRESGLLDYIIVGKPDERNDDGVFGLAHFKKSFRSENPWPPKTAAAKSSK